MAALDIVYSTGEFSKLIRVFLPELSSFGMFLHFNKENMDCGAMLACAYPLYLFISSIFSKKYSLKYEIIFNSVVLLHVIQCLQVGLSFQTCFHINNKKNCILELLQ